MSTQTERLVAVLGGDSSGLQASLKSATTDAKKLDTAIDNVGKSAKAEMAAGLARAESALDSVTAAEEKAIAAATRLSQSQQTATTHVGGLGGALNVQSGEVAAASSAMQKYKGVIDGAVTKMGPAGEMVNKVTTLLGPMGLALGGVTAALVGVNLGVGAFNNATTTMLEKTEQGREILAAIQPDFVSFGKVLEKQFESQRDLIDVGARAQAVNAAWEGVLDGLTAPFTAFGELLGGVTDAMFDTSEAAEELRKKVDALRDEKAAEETAARVEGYRKSLEDEINAYVAAQQEELDIVGHGVKLINDVRLRAATRYAEGLQHEREIALDEERGKFADAEEMATRRAEIQRRYEQDVQTAMTDARLASTILTREEADQIYALAEARDKAAESAHRETAATRESATARRASARPVDVDAGIGGAMDAVGRAQAAAASESQKQAEAAEAQRMARMVADKQTEFELIQKGIALNEEAKAAEESRAAKVRELLDQEKQARADLAQYMGTYVGGFVRSMAAVTIAQAKDDKERRKAYRTAVADQIQALGDYATTKSIVSAAEGNFAMAATLATAAATAYATASIMRPSGAPSASAAGAAPAASAPPAELKTINNTLIINDAFSDSEQIARRFATVYRGANDRGLLPRGA